MRAILALLALAVPLAACSLGSTPRSGPTPQAPLRAWISPPGFSGPGGLQFYVNRPAHVALFEIVPGRGVGLMYPRFGDANQTTYAGYNRARTGIGSFRWGYRSSFAGYSGSGYSRWTQPRYYFLVASDEPLRIDDTVASPTALRGILGINRFAAYNPYNTMEELTRRVVPPRGAGNYVTDLYVHWPEPPPARLASNAPLRVIYCKDGGRIVVRWDSRLTACPGDRPANVRPGDGEMGDSARVRKPDPRRPEPARVGEAADDAERARPEIERVRPKPVEPVERPEIRRPEPRAPRPEPRQPEVRKPEPRTPRAEPRQPEVRKPTPTPRTPRAAPRSPTIERRAPRPAPRPTPRVERPTRERSSDPR